MEDEKIIVEEKPSMVSRFKATVKKVTDKDIFKVGVGAVIGVVGSKLAKIGYHYLCEQFALSDDSDEELALTEGDSQEEMPF